MGIQVYWHDPEQTILIYKFGHEWNWDDIYAAADQRQQMLDAVEHSVSVIMYSEDSFVKIPNNALNHLRRLVKMANPKEKLLVLVGGPPLLQALLDTLGKVYRLNKILANYVYTDTLDEALSVIETRRAGA